ncbi:MAG: Rieske 2Fe-2S domain-containing protein [Bacteroidia bacterium]|nr:Rieske 2Fe-2S domain-containing protein [Bacteroidia bacterium]
MNRKEFLKNTAVISSALAVGVTASACSLFEEAEMNLCAEHELPVEGFKTFIFNRKKILVRRAGDKLEIISLVCTHKRCTVAFQADERIFVCPCHEGTYDYEGRVVDGPPPSPLRRYAYELRDGRVWVLNQFV